MATETVAGLNASVRDNSTRATGPNWRTIDKIARSAGTRLLRTRAAASDDPAYLFSVRNNIGGKQRFSYPKSHLIAIGRQLNSFMKIIVDSGKANPLNPDNAC
ncbi:MAG: hypothetical protein ING19_10050 [Azospirillum sp.]|nr:hypothetical protein [Azospirillum sp.]